jgi:hypothetical protein
MLALRCDTGLAWGKALTCSDRTAPADGWRFNRNTRRVSDAGVQLKHRGDGSGINQARPANRLFESSLIIRIVSRPQTDEE